MSSTSWDARASETAEKIFGASEAQLTEHAHDVLGDDAPIVAAAAFWPNGATQETIERGTVGGHHLGTVFGPVLGAYVALAGAMVGRGAPDDAYALATPLLVAVTQAAIHVIVPGSAEAPARLLETFTRATTHVRVKRRGFGRVVLLDDDTADRHFRLHAEPVRGLARSGPQRHVLAELTD